MVFFFFLQISKVFAVMC